MGDMGTAVCDRVTVPFLAPVRLGLVLGCREDHVSPAAAAFHAMPSMRSECPRTAPCLARSCRWGAALPSPDFLAAWQDQKTPGKSTEEKSHQCAGSQKH